MPLVCHRALEVRARMSRRAVNDRFAWLFGACLSLASHAGCSSSSSPSAAHAAIAGADSGTSLPGQDITPGQDASAPTRPNADAGLEADDGSSVPDALAETSGNEKDATVDDGGLVVATQALLYADEYEVCGRSASQWKCFGIDPDISSLADAGPAPSWAVYPVPDFSTANVLALDSNDGFQCEVLAATGAVECRGTDTQMDGFLGLGSVYSTPGSGEVLDAGNLLPVWWDLRSRVGQSDGRHGSIDGLADRVWRSPHGREMLGVDLSGQRLECGLERPGRRCRDGGGKDGIGWFSTCVRRDGRWHGPVLGPRRRREREDSGSAHAKGGCRCWECGLGVLGILLRLRTLGRRNSHVLGV